MPEIVIVLFIIVVVFVVSYEVFSAFHIHKWKGQEVTDSEFLNHDGEIISKIVYHQRLTYERCNRSKIIKVGERK